MPTVKELVAWNCHLNIKGRITKRREQYIFDPFELAIFLGNFEFVKFLCFSGYNIKSLMYLYTGADIPNTLDDNPEMLVWLREQALSPPSLFRVTLLTLRACLGPSIKSKVNSLPLPSRLKNSIILRDLFEDY